ncbi:MAG: 3'-5' exonuclease [Candidatus Peregrinibacteria bacterium]
MLPAFTVFDVETTGLDPKRGHRIIEIAAVRIEAGHVIADRTFVELVNPERPIPPEAGRINKIRDQDVRDSPTIDQVLPRFLSFSKESVLIAHNAEFDMGFLETEKECCWGYIDLPECLCTLKLSRTLYPHEYRHSLDIVGARLGITLPTALHRALPDVLLTAQAFVKMLSAGKIERMEDLRRMAGIRQMVA